MVVVLFIDLDQRRRESDTRLHGRSTREFHHSTSRTNTPRVPVVTRFTRAVSSTVAVRDGVHALHVPFVAAAGAERAHLRGLPSCRRVRVGPYRRDPALPRVPPVCGVTRGAVHETVRAVPVAQGHSHPSGVVRSRAGIGLTERRTEQLVNVRIDRRGGIRQARGDGGGHG